VINFSPPVLIPQAAGADAGLICGFEISRAAGINRVLELASVDQAPAHTDSVVWLHFNLSNAKARQTIARDDFMPVDAQEIFCDHDTRRRVELCDGGLLVVISDLTFEPDSDPADVAPLWCYIGERTFITGRTHPLKTADELRSAVKAGLIVESAIELLTWIISRRTATLRDLTDEMAEQVSELEDEILAGGIREQREQLGRIRRLCAQIRRHFGPDRSAFRKLLQQRPALLSEDQADQLRSEIEELSFLIDETNEIYERAKLLQEELASRLAENTGRSLYVLAILSAVFLPMTLITGVFGMNVAGLPGLHSPAAFWRVMMLIFVAGAVTLGAIFWRRRS
jgi:zinc transporter